MITIFEKLIPPFMFSGYIGRIFCFTFIIIIMLLIPTVCLAEENDTVNVESQIKDDTKIQPKVEDDGLLTEKELLEQIIEMKEDRIGLLEGNIQSLLVLIGIIITLLALLFTIFGTIWGRSIKKIRDDVEQKREEVFLNTNKSKRYSKQLEKSIKEVDNAQEQIVKSREKLDDSGHQIQSFRSYLKYMEYKMSDVESMATYTFYLFDFENIKRKLSKYIKKDEISNSADILRRFYKMNSPYITKENETISDIYPYLLDTISQEEKKMKEYTGALKKKESTFRDYMSFEDQDDSMKIEGGLRPILVDWLDAIENLKFLLECIEVELKLNGENYA